jgi:hypothetical protein
VEKSPKYVPTHFYHDYVMRNFNRGQSGPKTGLLIFVNLPRVNNHPLDENFGESGTDVMIFKIFSLKNSAKKLAFLTQNKAKLCKNLIITLVFEKNANFFAENCDHNIGPRSP